MSVLVQARPIERDVAPTQGEIAAWGGLLALALLVRLVGLDAAPLDPEEGRRALEGWTLWREGRVAYAGGPLLPNLQSILFGLFTAGDAQARLIPALVGAATVAAAWPFRPVLGPLAAWCTGTILAVCPPLVVASRSATPTALVACSVVLLVACACRFARDQDRRWLTGLAVALLLGLASDPSFSVALAGLAIAVGIAEGELLVRPPWWPALRAGAGRALVVAAIVGLALDTRLLMNPIGIQAGLVDPLWRWSGDLVRGSGLVAPLLLLLIDGGILALAAIGATEYRRHGRAVRILGCWLLVSAMLTALTRQPDLRYLLLPMLPASLLAGLGLRRVLEPILAHGSLSSTVAALVLLVPFVTAGFQVNKTLADGRDAWATAAIVVVGGFLLVALLALNWLAVPRFAAALATFFLIAVALWSATTTSRLLEARESDTAQLLNPAVLTDEIHAVREEVLKWSRANPDGVIPVDPALRPVVGWALRDVQNVRYDVDATRLPVSRLLVEPPAGSGPDLRARRLIVGYAADWATLDLAPTRIWRWVVGRQPLVDVRPYAILLVQPASL